MAQNKANGRIKCQKKTHIDDDAKRKKRNANKAKKPEIIEMINILLYLMIIYLFSPFTMCCSYSILPISRISR